MRIKGLFTTIILAIILLPLVLVIFPVSVSASATSLTLTPDSGIAGTSVSISGNGFVGRLATIYWDGKIVVTDIPISEAGEFTHSFDIPTASKGEHTIEVTDDSNWSASTASAIFTMLPQLKIFPRVARPWTEISIIGNGFAAHEKDIRITWDGIEPPDSPSTADALGKWSTSFYIPDVNKGEHFIGASGSVTGASEVEEFKFIIGPVANMEPASGPVGTVATFEGLGFRVGEDGVTITYDSKIIKCNIAADSEGSWNTTVAIPASVQGEHTVGIYGSSFTPKGIVPDTVFEVLPQVNLQPISGNIGNKVTVTGTGYTTDEAITLRFDETTLDIGELIADNVGSFSITFKVPQGKRGKHIISTIGDKDNSAQTTYTIEKSAPAALQLLSPAHNARLEIFSSFGDVILGTAKYLAGVVDYLKGYKQESFEPALVTFRWVESADFSDVTYTLQITPANDSSSPVLTIEDLDNPEYGLSEDDALAPGRYSWRANATDDRGNEGPWSEAQEFEMVAMSNRVLILSIACPVLFICLLVFGIFMWRVNR